MTTITETKKLIAFHGDKTIKKKYVDRVKAHKIADEIIKGIYWENGKGCAVGCTIHSSEHAAYETELGIPSVLARLEDGIFESLTNGRAKDWPLEFLSAIKVGSDLSNIWPQFAIWMLIDEQWGVLQFAKKDKIKESIIAVAKFYQEGKFAKDEHYDEIRKIRYAATAAAAAAYAAAATAYAAAATAYAATAADAAAYADAAAATDAAAYAAAAYAAAAYADAAATVADTADAADAAAAYATAAAAYAADAAYATAATAKQKWRNAQADKLLELMKGAPIK